MPKRGKLKRFFSAWKPLIYYLVFYIVFSIIYTLIQQFNLSRAVLIKAITFEYIPLATFFVIFYISYYLFIASPFFFFRKNKTTIYKFLQVYILIALISCIFYLVFPIQIPRPELPAASGIKTVFYEILLLIYHKDLPLNTYPSLHVGFSLAAALAYYRIRKKWLVFAVPVFLLILLSTVMVRQHIILDAIGAIAISLSAYLLVFKEDIFGKIKTFFSGSKSRKK